MPFVTQVAFGADAKGTSNPDLFKIMKYTRQKGIIPNITIADCSDKIADKLVKYVGAVAVSRYKKKDYCYNSVKKLTKRGLKQTNIHILVSEESYEDILETFEDIHNDSRLAKLNAIVLLNLKKKGRGVGYHRLSDDKFNIESTNMHQIITGLFSLHSFFACSIQAMNLLVFSIDEINDTISSE